MPELHNGKCAVFVWVDPEKNEERKRVGITHRQAWEKGIDVTANELKKAKASNGK